MGGDGHGDGDRPFGNALASDPDRMTKLMEALRMVGRKYGKTPSQVSLNWVMCRGAVPIPGAKNPAQAKENCEALGWRLSEEECEWLAGLGADGTTSDFQHG